MEGRLGRTDLGGCSGNPHMHSRESCIVGIGIAGSN